MEKIDVHPPFKFKPCMYTELKARMLKHGRHSPFNKGEP